MIFASVGALDNWNKAPDEWWEVLKSIPVWPDWVCVVLLLITLVTCLNCVLSLAFFTALKPAKEGVGSLENSDVDEDNAAPRLSVLIPARNEEFRLPDCLDSLLVQTFKDFEIIVLNDHSEDKTSEVVLAAAKKDQRVRLVEGKALPESWVGKNWACHQLAQQARGELLLFTDADTVHHAGALAAAVDFLEKNRAGMVSLWPRQITQTWAEWLVIPLIYVLILALRPQWLERLRGWAVLGAANGQFILFKRTAYEKVGGHKSVSGHLVEDVALSRLARSCGVRTLNVDGSNVVACRMYENFAQVWEGFTKNLRAMFDNKTVAFVIFGIVVFCLYVLPFLLLPVLLILGHASAAILCAAQCCLVWGMRALLAARFMNPPMSVILHPVGQVLVLLIACNSWLKLTTSGVSWKGRVYGKKS